ncbi:hypothetical protein L209DRAFT_777978 [Thermothelomyces heterothallicus CBS 203.75]
MPYYPSPPNDRREDNDQTSDPERYHSPVPDGRGEQDEDGPVVAPQTQDDKSSNDLELADAEPRPRSQSPYSAGSNRGAETRQRSDRCRLSQLHDHYDGSSQTSDPEQRDPLVSGDREEQDKEGQAVVPSQAQETMADLPRLSHDGNNDRELADAEPFAQSSIQPSASQPRAHVQRFLRRRRYRDTDDREDYYPTVGSDAEHDEKDDVVRPPRRKRRRVSTIIVAAGGTASQRRTRPDRGNSSSREARGSSQRPMRQGKPGTTCPTSSREPTLERGPETDGDAAATFEEWPLGNAVLKRVTVAGSPPTFMVQFIWDPYTPEDDTKICQLKDQGLSWPAIAKQFLGRTAGAIEVRYHTKLKAADPSRIGTQHVCDLSREPSAEVDGFGEEEEWEVEEICSDRELDDSRLELLVKWKGGEETWEPYENVAEIEALDRYERLHGPISVNIV